jgi:hypothetical protein
MNRAISTTPIDSAIAVNVLPITKQKIVASKTGLRRKPWVRLVSGIAANSDPSAYIATSCPAIASEI